MRKQFFLLIGFVIALFTFIAPSYSQTASNGFLWEARKGDRSIALVGTIHMGRPSFAQLAPDILERVRTASVIAVEADLSNAQQTTALMLRYALYAPGTKNLNEQLSAQLRERLAGMLARYGMAPQMVAHMKPWLVAMTLTQAEFARLGLSPAQGTEAQLFALAAEQGKRIVELESVEQQLQLFERAPPSVQIAYLERTIESIETGEAQADVHTIADAWSTRDYEVLERLIDRLDQEAAASPAARFMTDELVHRRNARMLQTIERLSAQTPDLMVAVGSLHFAGPTGLVHGLRNRGWTVTEVR